MTLACATVALVAFAANSVLCRIALRDTAIDPATFSTVRLVAGAVALLLLTAGRAPARFGKMNQRSWTSAALLALYAVPFSFAYTDLMAGTGALILFGCVQITMLSRAVWSGERPRPGEWLGVGVAAAGLVYLVLPGLATPPLVSAVLMGSAGIAWGAYSLRGRGSAQPLWDNRTNFVRSIPFAIVASLLTIGAARIDARGLLLAVASGAIASGVGYAVWYAALPGLTAVQAAMAQLAVPILAGAGGVMFLAEPLSARLLVSTGLVLGGIAVAVIAREAAPDSRSSAPR